MNWPWKSEKRNDSYTDLLVSYALSRANATGAAPAATGALEAASGIVSRCFAAADVSAPDHAQAALGPGFFSQVGRALIRSGEAVYFLDIQGGELTMTPAETWDVSGGSDPSTWVYRVSLGGPDRTETIYNVGSAGVIHCRYSTNTRNPWQGIGPLQSATLSGRLSAETQRALGDELSGPVGSLLPVGADGSDPTITALKADIRTLGGSVALVEKLADWATGGGPSQGAASEWHPRRIGANPPASVVNLASQASLEVLSACGVPPSLFTASADGTGQREAFRRLLHSTINPLAKIVQAELSMKVGGAVNLSFDSIFAADLSGRARAFQSLVGGGMDVTKAASLAGLLEAD